MKNVLASTMVEFKRPGNPQTSHMVYVVSNGSTPEATVWVARGEGKFIMNFQPEDFTEGFKVLETATGKHNLLALPVYAEPNIGGEITSYEQILSRPDGFDSLIHISDSYKF